MTTIATVFFEQVQTQVCLLLLSERSEFKNRVCMIKYFFLLIKAV